MNAHRSVSGSWCSMVILIAFAAMLAASITPACASALTYDCGDTSDTGTLSAGSVSLYSSWWDSSWDYRKNVTVSHVNASGSALTNYPALINVSKETAMQDTFNDIRFVTTDDVEMKFELEAHKNDYALFWVNITSLPTSGTSFWMYYGNDAASSGGDPEAVWNSGYAMVQHLQESPGYGLIGHLDSTSNDNDGAPYGFDDTPESKTDGIGKIDGADVFDGLNDYVDCGNDASLQINANSTVSSWINFSGGSGIEIITANCAAVGYIGFYFAVYEGDLRMQYSDWGGYYARAQTTDAIPPGWAHVAGTYDGNEIELYINGIQQALYLNEFGNRPYTISETLTIGARDSGLESFFNGSVDEVRISNVTRTSDWIKQDYEMVVNQTSIVTFVVPEAPAITSWGNDKTNNDSATVTVNESVSVCFNATANQMITTWNWYNDTADQLSNFDNYTASWSVNGTNTVSVNATNANGTSNTVTWTVIVNDIRPPAQVLNLANDTTTATTVDLSWTANTEEADLAGYRVYQNGALINSTVNTHYNVTALSSSTTYEFNVSAYDDNDLEGENASVTVTTAATVHPAPVITSWGNNKTDNDSTTITINESESVRFNATANQTIDTWHWYNNGADQSNDFDNYTTSWSVNGTNTVSVNATNATNGTSDTKTWTITVNDITAPAPVQGLANDTTTATTVDLSWTANTETDLVGYRVYRNGTLIASPPKSQTYCNVTGLSSSTTYEFNVSAYDDNDLEGENVSVTVTTAAAGLPCTCGDICVNETGWWRGGGMFNASGTRIQAAVDAASSGETICVVAGSYTENVNVNKPLTLAGEGAGVVNVISPGPDDDHVFNVTADYVNISGFNVSGAISYDKAGIYLNSSQHCNISDNIASSNEVGIALVYSSNNTLTSNTASGNDYGIMLEYSSNYNTLTSNTASDNWAGIWLGAGMKMAEGVGNNTTSDNFGRRSSVSSNDTLTDNGAPGKGYGIMLDAGVEMAEGASNNTLTSNNASSNEVGIALVYSNNNTLSSNTASSNEVGIALEDSSNNTLTSNTANSNYYYGIVLGYSSNNTLASNTASGNWVGIWLEYSNNNTLSSNNASDNEHGIVLVDSNNYNILTDNTANSNDYFGIYLGYSSSNTLTSNTASGNSNWDIYIEDSSSTFTDNTLNGTTVSFTYSGDVSLKGAGSPAADPSGRHSIGKFINATNQSAGARLYLNFSYSGADVSGLDESSLKVWKYNGTTWLEDGWNGTRYLSTANNVVGVNITSFSVFAPMALAASGAGSSSGGSGTYPPGWYGTPTATVTATKAPATATATAAPPDDKATPVPTKKPAVTKATTPTAEGTTAETAKKDAPGFTAVFAIAGVLAVAYAMMRRRE